MSLAHCENVLTIDEGFTQFTQMWCVAKTNAVIKLCTLNSLTQLCKLYKIEKITKMTGLSPLHGREKRETILLRAHDLVVVVRILIRHDRFSAILHQALHLNFD